MQLSDLYEQQIKLIGEDLTREGLIRTPQRAAKALQDLTQGYTADLDTIVNNAIFTTKCDEQIVVKGTEFYSLCEHHMLPFWGSIHVAYIPHGQIIGLSKIPRIIDCFAKRLQIQEELTVQIASALEEILNPLGVAVICEAQHLCMLMRGVQKQRSSMITSAMLGVYRTNSAAKSELLNLLK